MFTPFVVRPTRPRSAAALGGERYAGAGKACETQVAVWFAYAMKPGGSQSSQ